MHNIEWNYVAQLHANLIHVRKVRLLTPEGKSSQVLSFCLKKVLNSCICSIFVDCGATGTQTPLGAWKKHAYVGLGIRAPMTSHYQLPMLDLHLHGVKWIHNVCCVSKKRSGSCSKMNMNELKS